MYVCVHATPNYLIPMSRDVHLFIYLFTWKIIVWNIGRYNNFNLWVLQEGI